MDDKKEGLLLIGTTMTLLMVFLITILAVMIIYRRRKLQHLAEIDNINKRFHEELLQAQMEVQQETMQYIGREIHDNIGQKLTLAALYAQQLDSANAMIQEKVDSIAAIINESLADLRSLSKSLTTTNYLQTDLESLIKNECRKVDAAGSCKMTFHSNCAQLNTSEAVKSFLIRIIQEFIQNSLKHANCTEIGIRLHREEAALEIDVEDNGKGFDLDASEVERTGIGISNMEKRAAMIHASLTLKSIPGQGTKMRLSIPSQYL